VVKDLSKFMTAERALWSKLGITRISRGDLTRVHGRPLPAGRSRPCLAIIRIA
jgi:hypothetical protein